MEIKTFSEQVTTTWSAEKNKFWEIILKCCIIVGSSASGRIAVDKLIGLQEYGVHKIIFTVAGYILAAVGGLGLGAKITKK